MAKKRPRTPQVCPVCDHDVPREAPACPECGADHNSGWRDDAGSYDLDLPDEEFDYDEFVRKEFGADRFKPAGIKTIWWVTAIVIIVVSVVLFILTAR